MGPLAGVRVVEFTNLAPAPFAAMLLGDLGAEVVRIDRPNTGIGNPVTNRSRAANLGVDLKNPVQRAAVLDLIAVSDALIEGFRPGVLERLGLGPEDCMARNPRLVYGRVTGWGQDGPLASTAGHDINYLSIAGALAHLVWHDGRPTPPLNLLGDFAGGGMLLAFGIVAALFEARGSGRGQVIDAAMIDGAATLFGFVRGMHASGRVPTEPGGSFLSGAVHQYNVYETADGHYLSVGALEPEFHALFAKGLGIDIAELPGRDVYPQDDAIERIAAIIKTKSRAQWQEVFEGTDACVSAVLDPLEAAVHPHNRERDTYFELDGVVQPSPAPRFSHTPTDQPVPARPIGSGRETLAAWGLSSTSVDTLVGSGG